MDTNNNAYKNKQVGCFLSWPVIITCWVFIWPVGLILTWLRVSVDKKAALNAGRILTVLGWFFLVFGGLGILASISEGFDADDRIFIPFFILAALALIVFGRYLKKSGFRFKKYIALVVNQQMQSIDSIAGAIPTTYDKAKKELQNMINKGYFEGAYINDETREIVLSLPKVVVSTEFPETVNAHKPKQMKVVNCKSCGANNTIMEGTVGECEYCGSSITST